MTRYGPDVIAIRDAATGFLKVFTGSAPVYSDETGGTQLTDMTTTSGVPTSTVTADSDTGRIEFDRPGNGLPSVWVEIAAGVRWQIDPNDLDSRAGGVASVSLNGGTPQTGAVAISALTSVASTNISDASTPGKAVLTGSAAAGRTALGSTSTGDAVFTAPSQTAARTAIGAGTSNLALGTTSTTAKAGDYAPDLTPYAVKSGTLRQFVDMPTTVPPDGSLMMWDGGTNKWAFISAATLLTSAGLFDANGRISTNLMPKYYHDTPIINQGDDAPTDAFSPIVFERPGVGVLTPTKLGENSVQGASVCAVTLTEPLAIGDYLVLVAGASGEVATPALGSVSASFSAGAPTITWVPLNFPNGSAAVTIGLAKMTAAAPTPPTVTFTARDTGGTATNRVHLLAGVFRAPGVASTTPMDVAQNGNGNSSSTMTTITTAAPTADLAQPNELVFGAAVWNSGAGTVDRSLAAAGNWSRLMQRESDNTATGGAQARSLAVFYEQVTAGGRPVLQTLMTASDNATGQWASQLLPLKVGA